MQMRVIAEAAADAGTFVSIKMLTVICRYQTLHNSNRLFKYFNSK